MLFLLSLPLLWHGLAAPGVPADPPRWPDERQLGPFYYHADFQLQAYAHLLREVAQLQHDVPRELGLTAGAEPVHLYFFGHKATYRKYMQYYFPAVPYRRALFIKQRGPGMVFAYASDEFEIDLRHESTHAVLHSMLPMVPLWLDEGLAEYFELPPEQRLSGSSHLKSVKWNVRWRRVPELESLEQLDSLGQMKAEHYRDAWSWVHFLLHGPPVARRELSLYLTDIQSHVPPGRLSDRLMRRIPRLRHEYTAHFQRWK